MSSKNRAFLLTAVFLIFIGVLLLLLVLSIIKKPAPSSIKPSLLPIPSVSPTIPSSPPTTLTERVTINGVRMKNFYKNPLYVDKANDVFFFENENFKVAYLTQFNQFLISIKSSPFPELRIQAEEQFLRTLDISKEDACKLNVVITTPRFANPEYSGTNYPLSFCESG